MANKTRAQRYNDNLDQIWEEARQNGVFDQTSAAHTAFDESREKQTKSE